MGKITDERILAGKRRINSNAFGICFLALWGILLYRQFVLQQEISEYADIFMLTVGISLYVVINNILQGFYYTYRGKNTKRKVMIIGALSGTIVFSLSQVLIMRYDLSMGKDIAKLALQALIFLTVWVACQYTLSSLSEKQANKDIE